MSYYGFDTKVYTLLVGPNGKRLNVQDDVLTRIPMFKDAVKAGKIKQDIPFSICECDPKAVATLLAFVRDGRLPDLPSDTQKLGKVANVKHRLSNLVMAYQLALEFDLEAAQNAILDKVCPLLKSTSKTQLKPNPNLSEKFRNSKMYLLMSRQFAYQLQEEARQRSDPLYSQLEVQELVQSLDSWRKQDIVVLMTHLLIPMQDCPVEAAMSNPCLYHVHKKTKLCGATPKRGHRDVPELSYEKATTTVKTKKTEKTEKSKKKTKEEEELQSTLKVKEELLQYLSQPSDQPRPEDQASTAHVTRLESKEMLFRGPLKPSVRDEVMIPRLDSRKAEPGHDRVNEKTKTLLCPEGWSDLEGGSDESDSAIAGVLTPTCSTMSAESAIPHTGEPPSAFAQAARTAMQSPPTVPHRNRRTHKYIRPERPARTQGRRLLEGDGMLEQTQNVPVRQEAEIEADMELDRAIEEAELDWARLDWR